MWSENARSGRVRSGPLSEREDDPAAVAETASEPVAEEVQDAETPAEPSVPEKAEEPAAGDAQVVVAGNVAQHLDVKVDGAHVAVLQSAALTNEITYTLSGSSTAGSFFMDGELKAALVLDNLTLTNPDSSAVKIESGKRLDVELKGTNALADAVNGTHKGCLYLNGHSEWTGSGTLTLAGNTNHAIFADEYLRLANTFTGTITVTGAVSDGLHVNQYYKQQGGTVNITNVGGDGVDADDYGVIKIE